MTKGQRKMNDYKLVPYDPAPEMVSAAEDAYMPFGDMELALRMAILAAPVVQEEPVAYAVFADNGNIRIWSSNPVQAETMRQKYGDQIRPLYTAPKPAEQQPDVTQLVEAALALADACRRKIYPQPDKPDSAWAKLKDLDSALAAYRKGGE